MKSLWSDREAEQFRGDLGQRVYTSRLLGRDRSLVLHGGGNTSVKIRQKNLFGEEETILYVKGSGWDLETIEPQGFSPVLLAHVLRLAELPSLSDPEMVNQLVTHMLKAAAPAPSIETILHGLMPQKFVDHTHADAVLAVTNSRDGERRIREIYGKRCVVIPYLIPGFDLAQFCAKEFRAQGTKDTVGMVLLNHGIFSFGETARESYERMIELVTLAEKYLDSKRAWSVSTNHFTAATVDANSQATLRRKLSDTAGIPLILKTASTERMLGFAQHPEIARISQQGPATPDHVIRTKRTPMLGTDVDRYVAEYGRYFGEHAPKAKEPNTMLDPAPRVVLDPAFGLAAAGRTAKDTVIVEEIYDHTIDVILRAEALGGFQALPPKDIFDVEYWDLEQAKLKKGGKPPEFAGEVTLVTGAASGIGKAAVAAFLARGAAVVGLDLDPRIESLHTRPDFVGFRCEPQDRRFADRGVAQGDERQPRCQPAPDAHLPSVPETRPPGRAGGGHRLEKRSGAGSGGIGLFGFEGRAEPACAHRGARMGRGRHTHQHRAPERGVRYRPVDRRGARPAGQAVRDDRGGIQDQQRAQDPGRQPRRRGAGGGDVRGAFRQDHRRPGT